MINEQRGTNPRTSLMFIVDCSLITGKTMPADVILRTLNLGKRYKNRWAAEDVNLEIHRGDVFGFLGPNGAGKSTTIRMILSLIQPTTGSVELFGPSTSNGKRKKRSQSCGDCRETRFLSLPDSLPQHGNCRLVDSWPHTRKTKDR